jgi:hypothetical protein
MDLDLSFLFFLPCHFCEARGMRSCVFLVAGRSKASGRSGLDLRGWWVFI